MKELTIFLGIEFNQKIKKIHPLTSFPVSDELFKNLTSAHACGHDLKQISSDSSFL